MCRPEGASGSVKAQGPSTDGLIDAGAWRVGREGGKGEARCGKREDRKGEDWSKKEERRERKGRGMESVEGSGE